MAELRKVSAAACDDPQRMADVVFIHGLGGDASGTWRYGEGNDTSWPHWLAQDFPQVGVWSLDYAASKWKPGRFLKWFFSGLSAKLGHSMPLPKRANDVLRTLMLNGFGERPIVLICHSLGGLVAKEVLRQSHREAKDAALKAISVNTQAVMFLATPHRGATLASRIDTFRKLLGTTITISDLKAFDRHLLELLGWYSGHADGKIETVSYCEERGVGELLRIVDEFSANPEVGVVVSADEDHLSIAKPEHRGHNIVLDAKRLLTRLVRPVLPEHAREETVPHPHEIPCQLPPAAHTFFGRVDALQTLVDRLRNGLTTVAIADAGMGKTALSAEALRQLLGTATPAHARAALAGTEFPDGIVFLDLYRHHGQADQAWTDVANALCGSEFLPMNVASVRAVQACASKRFLLIVEGGEEARGCTDVDGFVRTTRRALLDPLVLQGPVLWLTRRSDQSLPQEELRLDQPLGDVDARALFDHLSAGRVATEWRDRALAMLGGHPLAITWAAALLGRGDEPPQYLLDDLQRQPGRNLRDPEETRHTLHWLFERSLRGLDEHASRSLHAAGLLAPEPFPLATIAAGTGLDERAQRDALAACVRSSLLRLEPGDTAGAVPHWRFGHALCYVFARSAAEAKPDTRVALLPGLAQWAHTDLRTCQAADTAAQAHRSLQHAIALLRADAAPGLWLPLVNPLLYNISDRFVAVGQLTSALSVLQAVEAWLASLPAIDADAIQWQREVAACHSRLGNLMRAQGNLPGAQRRFEAGLCIAERLAAQDPSNAGWQRDLSVSHNKLGALLQVQGDLPGAQRRFEAGLRIAERLATQDPAKAEWQRDLSVSHNKLGDLLQAQDDLPGAQRRFEASEIIIERLAAQDPAKVEWQHDLSFSHHKLGLLLEAQGDLPGAQRRFEAGLCIAQRLAAQDPANARCQRDLSVCYDQLGAVLQARGDLPGARWQFETSLGITERLIEQDAANAEWQRDLSASYTMLGELLRVQGDLPGAQKRFEASNTIIERLAAQDPANAGWQRDLAVNHTNLAMLMAVQGDVAGGLSRLQKARVVLFALVQRAPGHPQFQRDLDGVEKMIATLENSTPAS